ncbi:RES family NAD+ phosphorylase [Lichenicoccus roseus]|uniref:RES domain-containing protein n=1 Tax=Lichenicoccus roseus TaxID=2683649 RepID=A0A5R9J9K3_9PROT|nr:RES family NAD+ phosphorylase [Lichenicoccus roseus]TLU73227.1 RES domain-containing protein [Lichenicoccus roseus]
MRLRWKKSHRIIRTVYPTVHLFEDIADPADWDRIARAEARSNPRLRDEIGNLALVPVHRRVGGATATLVMGAFTHASTLRPSRFSDGSFGVWYCGDRFEVALAETAYHFEEFMRATGEPAADADFRELTCAISGNVHDLRKSDPEHTLAPDDWSAGQKLGRRLRDQDLDGVVYPSVRSQTGFAAGMFWPNCVTLPVLQSRQFRYRWDGSRMTAWFEHGTRDWVPYEVFA